MVTYVFSKQKPGWGAFVFAYPVKNIFPQQDLNAYGFMACVYDWQVHAGLTKIVAVNRSKVTNSAGCNRLMANGDY